MNGSGHNPWGRGGQTHDLFRKIDKFKKDLKLPASPMLIIAAVLLVWGATGFFIVAANEDAVVKRFGKISRVVGPGPHYHIPFPIESVDKTVVTKVYRLEIGFRTLRDGSQRKIKEEANMLTGDENIVALNLVALYKVNDIIKYNYNVHDVPGTIKSVAESAIRGVVGKEELNSLLTSEKSRIQIETRSIMQEILDSYDAGIQVTEVQLQDVEPPDEVKAAFKDVVSAREDKNRFINESHAYRNKIIPEARAQSETMLRQAEAYEKEQIDRALGDASKFNQVLENYKLAPEITRKRLYLDAMSEVIEKGNVNLFDADIETINPFMGVTVK